MSFYKVESTFRDLNKNRKTYRYHYNSIETVKIQMERDLSMGAKVAVKSINESQYVKGINK